MLNLNIIGSVLQNIIKYYKPDTTDIRSYKSKTLLNHILALSPKDKYHTLIATSFSDPRDKFFRLKKKEQPDKHIKSLFLIEGFIIGCYVEGNIQIWNICNKPTLIKTIKADPFNCVLTRNNHLVIGNKRHIVYSIKDNFNIIYTTKPDKEIVYLVECGKNILSLTNEGIKIWNEKYELVNSIIEKDIITTYVGEFVYCFSSKFIVVRDLKTYKLVKKIDNNYLTHDCKSIWSNDCLFICRLENQLVKVLCIKTFKIISTIKIAEYPLHFLKLHSGNVLIGFKKLKVYNTGFITQREYKFEEKGVNGMIQLRDGRFVAYTVDDLYLYNFH
jgi:hypothetical protein